ncbi:MAG: hypothetical protein U0003_00230 [Vampirovibrionales bacterium]
MTSVSSSFPVFHAIQASCAPRMGAAKPFEQNALSKKVQGANGVKVLTTVAAGGALLAYGKEMAKGLLDFMLAVSGVFQ